jgi:hypothetical protein
MNIWRQLTLLTSSALKHTQKLPDADWRESDKKELLKPLCGVDVPLFLSCHPLLDIWCTTDVYMTEEYILRFLHYAFIIRLILLNSTLKYIFKIYFSFVNIHVLFACLFTVIISDFMCYNHGRLQFRGRETDQITVQYFYLIKIYEKNMYTM